MRARVRKSIRRGAVTVEMALIAPVFVALVFGMFEASRILETQNLMAAAARSGARLAAMDRSDLLSSGQTTNQKIATDIKNFLTASGVPGAEATVHIVSPDDHTTPVDLDDPANDLKLFELRVEVPVVSAAGGGGGADPRLNLVAKIFFRNARSSAVP